MNGQYYGFAADGFENEPEYENPKTEKIKKIIAVVIAVLLSVTAVSALNKYRTENREWLALRKNIKHSALDTPRLRIKSLWATNWISIVFSIDESAVFEDAEVVFENAISNLTEEFIEEISQKKAIFHHLDIEFICRGGIILYEFQAQSETNFSEWTVQKSPDEAFLNKKYYITDYQENWYVPDGGLTKARCRGRNKTSSFIVNFQ